MRFTWDPAKSDRTLQERGFDFAFAALIFAGPTVERADRRHAYGEVRRVAIGRVGLTWITLVYTDRLAADGHVERRIISARLSNRKERDAWWQANPDP